jgi:predicted RND superfamily exporter protein
VTVQTGKPEAVSFKMKFEEFIYSHRPLVIGLFVVMTALMVLSATRLHIDAGFSKLLPLEHEYMKTFVEHRQEFGGANRILVALVAPEGDIFTPEFFEALKTATDELFFIPGVDRTSVKSLFSPSVRFTEVVEDGIAGGNVIPADFEPTPEGFKEVRENILKAGIVGRLVANDFSGALISAQLLEFDPNTGEPLDYIFVAEELEQKIRGNAEIRGVEYLIETHIIGFAKVIGDISDGARRAMIFFAVAFIITALAIYIYTRKVSLTLILLICSLVAVAWQLGLLTLLGYGIDPMGILVPFLIFAIGVSHGVQLISSVRAEFFLGASAIDSVRISMRQLIAPGIIALLSDTVGFITIMLIKIQVIQEMAITASLGVMAVIFTNLLLLPVLLTYVPVHEDYRDKLVKRATFLAPLWKLLRKASERRPAAGIIMVSALILGVGMWKAVDVKIGDMHHGVPELRTDSRYNVDSLAISNMFSIGVDLMTVIVETIPEGCIDHQVMTTIDEFAWRMRNTEGVQSVFDLPGIGKRINSGWNEGGLKWRVLPRNQSSLVQAVSYVPTESGLLNADCSVMPVLIFTRDHQADTIETIVNEVKRFNAEFGTDELNFRLATGNVGVMAATNEEVKADQFPILIGVFSAIILLCLLNFRSLRAVICIVVPLAIVSVMAYALMSILEIGLKVSTLPVVALGVGIGVDYGIYIFSRLRMLIKAGHTFEEAYFITLASAGTGVVFTGLTLAIGVATWIFSPLKFQADMGILLTFMFLVNMLGAILLLPALAAWLLPVRHRE